MEKERKYQHAFVKYTKAGKIVSGSLIIARNYPKDNGVWLEVTESICCEPDCECTGNGIKRAYIRFSQGHVVPGSLLISDMCPPDIGCWKEIPVDICCEEKNCTTSTTSTTTTSTSTTTTTTTSTSTTSTSSTTSTTSSSSTSSTTSTSTSTSSTTSSTTSTTTAEPTTSTTSTTSTTTEQPVCIIITTPSLISFETCPAGEPSTIESFIIEGSNLGLAGVTLFSYDNNTLNITIRFSLDLLGPFTDTLNISGSTILPTTVYVQYTPEFIGANSGEISAVTTLCEFDSLILLDILAAPFAPLAPTISNIQCTAFDLSITPGDNNPATIQYAIQDTVTGLYVSDVLTLTNDVPLWLTAAQWALTGSTIYNVFQSTLHTMTLIARDPITLLTTNGSIINVTTLDCGFAIISTRPSNISLGDVLVGTPSSVFSFVFKADELDGTDMIISGFTSLTSTYGFSLNPLGPFTPTLTFSGYGTSIPITQVYLTITPGEVGFDNGFIGLIGGSAYGAIYTEITGI